MKGDVSVIASIPQRERKNGIFTVPLPDAGDGLRQVLGMERRSDHEEDVNIRKPVEERYPHEPRWSCNTLKQDT